MPRYAMVIDQERCLGCQSCTVACKSEWDVPNGPARTKVRQTGTAGTFPKLSTSFYVSQCNHCDRPTCVPACPTGATYQEPNGIVRVHRDLCIGCGACVAACPYGARYINAALGKVDKCDFCASRVEQGLEPACVATCPGQAKIFGDLENPSSDVFRLVYRAGARRMETPTVAIGPNVYYAGEPEHAELALASFAPVAPGTITPGKIWSRVLNKFVYLAVGATFLGQAVAFFHQLSTGEKQFHE
ncbi:MAG TPA: 4Fe-4S dicluster domain-containing protein [Terriglobales bacterium]|nr:4Fe-4S dicluster domain-containing protein [Terriglobales bacterium]